MTQLPTFIIAAGAAAILALPALAQGGGGPRQAWTLEGGAVSFVNENDLYGGTDENYSNGLLLDLVSGPRAQLPRGFLNRVVPDFAQVRHTDWRTGVGLGHAIFTPSDIEAENPDPNDRPYAGWLFASFSFFGEMKPDTTRPDDRILDLARLEIGVVGDAAFGEQVQSDFHEFINGVDPKGWRFQLKNEPAFVVRLERQRRRELLDFGPVQLEGGARLGGALGTVETSASVGADLRFGNGLSGDFGPARLRPSAGGASFFDAPAGTLGSAYVFAGVEARGVARNIFLDGNTFQDSRSVDKEPFVFDAQAGAAVRVGKTRVAFTYVARTEEFKNQDGAAQFGAVTLSRRF